MNWKAFFYAVAVFLFLGFLRGISSPGAPNWLLLLGSILICLNLYVAIDVDNK